MEMTAGERVFVDTNVLVFCSLELTPLHQAALGTLDTWRDAGVELWISRQILREFMVVMTRPGGTSSPDPLPIAVADVAAYQNIFQIAEDGPATMTELLSLVESYSVLGKQVHDANIVATMRVNAIPKLLTHNVSDFKRFSSLITVLPLVP